MVGTSNQSVPNMAIDYMMVQLNIVVYHYNDHNHYYHDY